VTKNLQARPRIVFSSGTRQFVPPRVATSTNQRQLARLERRLHIEQTVDELLARAQLVHPGRETARPVPDPAAA
jgi:hypothetical protein